MPRPATITYRITHRTHYDYGGRIDFCHNEVRLQPSSTEFQQRVSSQIKLEPKPESRSERMDYFGNPTMFFSVEHAHEALVISAMSEVRVSTATRPWEEEFTDPKWEDAATGLESLNNEDVWTIGDFALPSRAVVSHEIFRRYAETSFRPNGTLFASTKHLMDRIFTEFEYVPGATEVHTTAFEALDQKQGVCQDFAHIMASCLRSLGLAARYVSGYMETQPPPGQPKLQGADASHAWVEVYIPRLGWTPFDPTNNVCPQRHHVVLARGRDYFDVQPLHGIYVGGGNQRLGVEVDVTRLSR